MRVTGNILALDIATLTGVAWGVPGEKPQSECYRLKEPDQHHDIAFSNMIALVDSKIRELKPELVFKESALSLEAFKMMNSSQANVELQYKLHGIVEGVCVRHGVLWDQEKENTIRKHFIGTGGGTRGAVDRVEARNQTKAAIVNRCHLLKYLPADCNDDNRADALAAWDYAAANFGGRVTEFALFGQKARAPA